MFNTAATANLVTTEFLEGCINYGFLVMQQDNTPLSAVVSRPRQREVLSDELREAMRNMPLNHFNIFVLTEWGTQTPLTLKQTIIIRLLTVMNAILHTKDSMFRSFDQANGFELLKMFINYSECSNHFRMAFCDFVMNFSTEKHAKYVKKFADLQFVPLLLSLLKSSCPQVKDFSIQVANGLISQMKHSTLRKSMGTKAPSAAGSLADTLTSLVDGSVNSVQQLYTIAASLEAVVYPSEAAKDELIKPALFANLVKALKSAAQRVDNIGDVFYAGKTEMKNEHCLLSLLINTLGYVAGKSETRQTTISHSFPDILPFLLDLLIQYQAQDQAQTGTAVEHEILEPIVSTIQKLVARNNETAYPINDTPGAYEALLAYYAKYHAVRGRPENGDTILFGPYFALNVLTQAFSIAEEAKLEEMYMQVWSTLVLVVTHFDSPLARQCYEIEHMVAILNFVSGMMGYRRPTAVKQLETLLDVCQCRGTEDLPLLTMLTDIQSEHVQYCCLPPAGIEKSGCSWR